jgi:hypothetical protein
MRQKTQQASIKVEGNQQNLASFIFKDPSPKPFSSSSLLQDLGLQCQQSVKNEIGLQCQQSLKQSIQQKMKNKN